MLDLLPVIRRIEDLLSADTEASVTYAALEARLAIERICYDRLRQRHDYISPADLQGWTPGYVINKILTEVDEHAATTMKLMIGKTPDVKPGDDDDFVEVGQEIGFDPKHISKLWNALGRLALHTALPASAHDRVLDYGDKAAIAVKVKEVLTEIRRLVAGTMSISGFGDVVSFECHCGRTIKRRAGLLRQDQSVRCFNPQCSRSFKVSLEGGGSHSFELEVTEIPCRACHQITLVPRSAITSLAHEEIKNFACVRCGVVNQIAWVLMRADPKEEATAADAQ